MPDASLFTRYARIAAERGDAPALIDADGSVLSHAGLVALAGRFAAALAARGVMAGDRVVVQVDKSLGAVGLYLGCQQLGAAFVPLNTAYTDAEVGFFLADAAPALFVHTGTRGALWPASVALGDGTAGGLWAEALALAPLAAIAPRGADDLAAICYTSGTTGRSKGAMISQRNLISNAMTLIDLWRFTAEDRLLHVLPVFHVHGLFVALHCALLSGACLLFEHGFEVGRARARLRGASVMMGVPTHYTRLLADPAFGREDCAGVRLFISGSAPLLAETHRAFAERTGHTILERYGMTEAGMITSNPYDGAEKGGRVAGTVGFALPDVAVRLRGEDGALAGPGAVGVLEIRGPNVIAGYWQLPEQSAEAFTSDGWFITGDLATMDGEGRVSIVGRAKDLIIAGGFNIYPKEIEEAIDAVAGVEESAVIGVPHPDFGESVVAVVVPRPGAAITPEAVMAAIAPALARFKHPRAVHIVPALPRNAMGKVQKAELRKAYGA